MPPTQENDQALKKAETDQKDQKVKFLPNGYELDHLGPGGIAQFVDANKVSWKRDIFPCFISSIVIMAVHLLYYLTGNLAIPIVIIHVRICYGVWFADQWEQDKTSISRRSERMFFADKRFFLPMWACIASGVFTWIWGLCLMSEDVQWNSYYLTAVKPKTWPQYIILVFVMSVISTIETNCGHELVHKRQWYNKYLGMFAFSQLFYSHFVDEHVLGHHKTVGLYEDPSTGRMNESIFTYFFREVYGTHKNVNEWEVNKIKRKYGKDCPWYALIVFNKMFYFFLLHVAICTTIYLCLGWASLKFHFVLAFFGLYQQCFANYVTHYGLTRKKDKNGQYEQINKFVSWNFVSSRVYFRLSRHSDHHVCSFRPYQILRRVDDGPQMPFQLQVCYYVHLIPPLWFWLMNDKIRAIDDHLAGKENKLVTWSQTQKPTPRDKLILRVAHGYFTLLTVIMFYFAFFSDTTNVLKSI